MNGKPGQVWDPTDADDVSYTKKLDQVIINTLSEANYKA